MSTNNAQTVGAYVIEKDGSKTAIPAGFVGQKPFASASGAAAMPKRSLHLGRRLLGLGIALIGVPLLILPGPGLALIGLGLLMAVMP